MSRMSDWNIDLTDLEDQIEDAFDEERRAGYQSGYEDGLAERDTVPEFVGLNKWDVLVKRAQDNHEYSHVYKEFPMRQCLDPLCRAVSEMDEKARP